MALLSNPVKMYSLMKYVIVDLVYALVVCAAINLFKQMFSHVYGIGKQEMISYSLVVRLEVHLTSSVE